MSALISDPTCTGVLSGTLDFPPFSSCLLCPSGVFRLFSPTDQPDTRHMVYEAAFEHGGKTYYLEGHKVARDDPGFDLWKDATTLYTTLHEGNDARGPVLGAGMLSLGMGDLIKLLSTLGVSDASGPTQRMETIGVFGRFFMGRLWDTYLHHVKG